MSQANHANTKIEIITNNGIIEIRYFDNPKDDLCRHWKLPEDIARDLISWWIELKKNEKIIFPKTLRSKKCEFAMHSDKCVDIKALDCCGRSAMTGWSLPVVVVERLVIWQNGKVK
jgi:hypothetical protein